MASFATMYMSIDKYDHQAVDPAAIKAALRPEDRWLTSRTERLKAEVTRSIEACDLHKAAGRWRSTSWRTSPVGT